MMPATKERPIAKKNQRTEAPQPPPAAQPPAPETNGDAGLMCPRCHCRDLRVRWTYGIAFGRIRRRRQCRHCGKMITTTEHMGG